MRQMKPSNINVTPNTSDMDDDDIDNNEDTNCEEFGRRIPVHCTLCFSSQHVIPVLLLLLSGVKNGSFS